MLPIAAISRARPALGGIHYWRGCWTLHWPLRLRCWTRCSSAKCRSAWTFCWFVGKRDSFRKPSRRELSALVPLLNRFTLIEFKGPTDVLERGDFAQLAGCSLLWHSQQSEPIPHEEVSLVVLSPTVSGALRDELRLLGCEASQHEPGIFRVTGLPFATWLVETDVMAERGQPVLSLVSRVFLKDRERIIEELGRTGHGALVHYMVQQIQQFRTSGKDFAMQHGLSDNLEELQELEEETPDQGTGGSSCRAAAARTAAGRAAARPAAGRSAARAAAGRACCRHERGTGSTVSRTT